MILFSVIIPHYNSVLLLKQLLDSIPIDESIQIIVVDDKSTEDITEVKDLTIARGGLFIQNTTDRKNAGVCRNLGLTQVVGKWLVFADADDYFLDGAFDIMKQHADSEADLIYFIPTSVDLETGEVSTRHLWLEMIVRRYLSEPVEENELVLRYRYKGPYSKMIRRKMVQEMGILFDEVIAANDVMFSAKCGYYAQKIEAFDDIVYCLTKSEGTLTTKHDESAYRSRIVVHRNYYKFLDEHIGLREHGYLVPMGIRVLRNAAKQGYSTKFLCEIYCYLRKENIPLINFSALRYSLRHLGKRRGI